MKALRLAGLILLVIFMIFLGYKRERYLLLMDTHRFLYFEHKHPRVRATDYHSELKNATGFHLSPKLTSSLLYSFSFTLITSTIIGIGSRKKSLFYLTVLLYVIYMLTSFLLILLGNWGVEYHLSVGLSHYLEDLFLSPFILMFMSAILIFARKFGWLSEN